MVEAERSVFDYSIVIFFWIAAVDIAQHPTL
jgi:hypothetical protein